MNMDHIIVQAGGLGSRLKKYTKNKPKALCPVKNKPLLFHLFDNFPDKRFIIIGDYKHDVLEKYLDTYAKVKYLTVLTNEKGTCSGIRQAIDFVPPNTSFMLIWSDLIINENILIDRLENANYIGISSNFQCRWSFVKNNFHEEPSSTNGVAGLFIFKDKDLLKNVPANGEFVKWLSENRFDFNVLELTDTNEVGTVLALNQIDNSQFKCRPFNKLEIKDNLVTKSPTNENGEILAKKEQHWYQKMDEYGFKKTPKIYSYSPFIMERLKGTNIFNAKLSTEQMKMVIDKLVLSLENLHSLKQVPTDVFSVQEAYFNKTIKRLDTIRNLVPFINDKYITINGHKCKNIVYFINLFKRRVRELLFDTTFTIIHGDCTFSNTIVDEDLNVTFIDPRGYFGFTDLYGDVYYDWSKLYYSIYGDYDQFNNKNFSLTIEDNRVNIEIESNGWRHLTDYYLGKIRDCDVRKIRFLHSIIWISLSTYVWDDYDSICCAFYNGINYIQEFLN